MQGSPRLFARKTNMAVRITNFLSSCAGSLRFSVRKGAGNKRLASQILVSVVYEYFEFFILDILRFKLT